MIAAHAMHSSAWRSGCGANVDVARRRGVMSPCRSKQQLTECPWPRLRYRLLRGWRPCSQDLREKKHAAPKCSRGSRERNDQSDLPISQACLLSIHAAHDSMPTPCVCLLEPVSDRKDWAGPAERTDGRRSVPCAPPFPTRQSPQSFRPDARSLPANNRELSRECGAFSA